jgi:hypothetical protein
VTRSEDEERSGGRDECEGGSRTLLTEVSFDWGMTQPCLLRVCAFVAIIVV